jgi:predicted DNA-binding transcriptional regulator AlpA
MEKTFLNQHELSQRWGISPRTLERWRWLGEGPRFLKLGGRVVYRLEDIEAFEAEKLRSSTSQTEPFVPDYRNERAVGAGNSRQGAAR